MPEPAAPPLPQFEPACRLLDEYILSLPSARQLSQAEIADYSARNCTAGWQIEIKFTDNNIRRVNVLVLASFPFSAPVFALVDRPPFLTWPHVEQDGALCLLENISDTDHDHPVAVFQALLPEAYKLIEDCLSGSNEDDFRQEFYSYWNPGATGNLFMSLIRAAPPSRLIYVWRGNEFSLLADDKELITCWLANRFGEMETSKEKDIDNAALIWLDKPLVPREYPRNGSQLLSIASKRTTGGRQLLLELSSEMPGSLVVLLGASTEHGPCLGGVTVPLPRDRDVLGRKRDAMNHGFRPGRIPKELQLFRRFNTASAVRSGVMRVDSPWIHGRDKDEHHSALRSATVAVLGCGSLGATVAVQLAMAGVGSLILVDGETLDWPNVGRHPLGANYVGAGKASSLAKELSARYPHSTFVAYDRRWEEVGTQTPSILEDCNLLVSAMGNWGAEDALNYWHVSRKMSPPIIYCWLERFATAGHAVGIGKSGGCLRCHFTALGEAEFRATTWPANTKVREPACGVTFQPYGPVEMSFSVAMAVNTVWDYILGRVTESHHRLYIGSEQLLAESGGSWTADVAREFPERKATGGIFDRGWNKRVDCPICSKVSPPDSASS